jgi:hypothetical protein
MKSWTIPLRFTEREQQEDTAVRRLGAELRVSLPVG